MLRCKEGDLAVVLEGPYAGYFVTVGKFLGGGQALRLSDSAPVDVENCWEVINAELQKLSSGWRVLCRDDNLQPIRPGRTPVTTETKKEVTA